MLVDAPIQNIGAYGVESEEFISGVEVFDVIEKNGLVLIEKTVVLVIGTVFLKPQISS